MNFTVTNPETGNLLQLSASQVGANNTPVLTSAPQVSAWRGVNATLGWLGTGLSGDGTTSAPSQYMAPSGSTTGTSTLLNRAFTLAPNTTVGAYNLYVGTPPFLALTGVFSVSTNAIATAVVDGAAFGQVPNTKNQIAPGSIISIFGTDLAAGAVTNSDFPVPTQLGGTSVKIGNRFAPLFSVSPGQINAMVPYEVSGTVDVLVVTGTNSFFDFGNITLNFSAPRIFVAGAQNSSGGGVGVIQDASQNYVAVSSASPASAGDVLAIYLEGLGVTTPPTTSGLGGTTGLVSGVTVTIGGMSAVVSYAGVAPGIAGLYQVNATVPAGLGAGNVNVVVTDSQGNSSNIVTVAVH